MNVAFDHVEDVAPGIKTFWFRPERKMRYIAGQFTELYLPHEPDERGVRRWFTLSSSPTEELVGVTTRFAKHGGSTFKHQLLRLQPGTEIRLADPMGDFVLPKDPSIPLLFVAAGLGITPVRSMVKWLLDTGEQRDITLLYAAGNPDELAFHDLFTQYAMRFIPHITQKDGRLNEGHIIDAVQRDNTQIYLSGPENMVETFYKKLQQLGISPDRLVGDYFPGYQQF
jgi:ferredoxin-NADP reductase